MGLKNWKNNFKVIWIRQKPKMKMMMKTKPKPTMNENPNSPYCYFPVYCFIKVVDSLFQELPILGWVLTWYSL